MFQGWDNYFFMLGSAGAGLTGLMFVVITLTSGFDLSRAERGARVYMTPTMVHFSVVLTVSAVAVAPRLSVTTTAAIIGLCGVAGLANVGWACLELRAMRRAGDPPHWSDFWFYGAGPAAVYAAMLGADAGLLARAEWAAQAMAGMLLLLLLLGIRNAWDLITWMAPRQNRRAAEAALTDALGAVAGDQAGADGVAVDGGKEQAG